MVFLIKEEDKNSKTEKLHHHQCLVQLCSNSSVIQLIREDRRPVTHPRPQNQQEEPRDLNA